ncbi:LysR family transcriptional regulator [Comamonadaceae bacterium PP-2]
MSASRSSPAAASLTPDALFMLDSIARHGSFAQAARELGLVPSALTYRVRQIEDALDTLLFDRSARHARPTPAGEVLLRESRRMLGDLEAVSNRVRRIATGWEHELTLAVDSLVSRSTVLDLCERFYALGPADDATLDTTGPPTRLRLRDTTLNGTLELVANGQADLAVGAVFDSSTLPDVRSQPLGRVDFVFAVAPHHALAQAQEPIVDEVMRRHRLVAVADSALSLSRQTLGLLPGQDVFTVTSMSAKLEAQLRGLGAGHLPVKLAQPYVDAGRLVVKQVPRTTRSTALTYLWRDTAKSPPGKALRWWLQQLERPSTRQALLERFDTRL